MAGNQVNNGKAFEYACLQSIYEALSISEPISIIQSSQLDTARSFFEELTPIEQDNMRNAANAAFRVIDRLEPQLRYSQNNIPLCLTIQSDAEGMAGDVRDVVCLRRQNDWEIGISCKHNHKAVKHSRLSATIDFGHEWLGYNCSRTYFNDITPIFSELEQMRGTRRWSSIPDKAQRYYLPVLNAFLDELRRLAEAHQDVPRLLIQYLLGRFDFYKVISIESNRITRVEAFNIAGSLNRSSGTHRSIVNMPRIHLPTCFYHIALRSDSETTAIVACDGGWELSMRIHNAESMVIPSLKFDVQLISLPNTIYAESEPWDKTAP